MASSRASIFLLVVTFAIASVAVSAAGYDDTNDTITWDDWYNYGYYNYSSYEDWTHVPTYSKTSGDTDSYWGGWGDWGFWSDWSDWSNWADWGSCGWWWEGTCYGNHYATVYGKVKDDKNRPVKGAQMRIACYHKVYDDEREVWGADTLFYTYNCYTDANGIYSYSRVPTKEYSYKTYGSHFSYCQVRSAKAPAKYTYLSCDRKDYKIGYWNTKYWKYDLTDNKRYNGPVYTYKYDNTTL